jgi:Torus domain
MRKVVRRVSEEDAHRFILHFFFINLSIFEFRDREDKYSSKTAAAGRCNVVKDSGYTRADKVAGSYFCLFFARGIW